ncbi:ATP-dependent DNA helicase PIF1 [Tanacetum coccineum]
MRYHHLSKLLGLNVTLVATSFSVKEADFGNQICQYVLKNLKIKIIGCSHKWRCDQLQCMLSTVGGGNEDVFFVATREEGYVTQLQ